jgi:hypothetical protein
MSEKPDVDNFRASSLSLVLRTQNHTGPAPARTLLPSGRKRYLNKVREYEGQSRTKSVGIGVPGAPYWGTQLPCTIASSATKILPPLPNELRLSRARLKDFRFRRATRKTLLESYRVHNRQFLRGIIPIARCFFAKSSSLTTSDGLTYLTPHCNVDPLSFLRSDRSARQTNGELALGHAVVPQLTSDVLELPLFSHPFAIPAGQRWPRLPNVSVVVVLGPLVEGRRGHSRCALPRSRHSACRSGGAEARRGNKTVNGIYFCRLSNPLSA